MTHRDQVLLAWDCLESPVSQAQKDMAVTLIVELMAKLYNRPLPPQLVPPLSPESTNGSEG